jgi:geranylgeranyl diphosphate synthase, type I
MKTMPSIFSSYLPYIEKQLKSLFKGRELPLYRMMQYHMGWLDENGREISKADNGKMVRATLCLLAAESVTGDFKKALPVSAAIELMHNYSLVHDDIQDGDGMRRHRPTVWKLWGSPQAINAGSALKMLADLSILRLAESGIPPHKQLDVFEILEKNCLSMIEGQYMDIDFEHRDGITVGQYLDMIEKKTSALISGALQSGAVLGLEKDRLEGFSQFGRYLGIAFQITDDILGIWGNDKKTGKPRGNDIRKKKKSLPIVFCMQEGSKEADKLKAIYKKSRISPRAVNSVLAMLEERGARDFCREEARKYYELAINELEGLPVRKEYAGHYKEIARFLIRRDF